MIALTIGTLDGDSLGVLLVAALAVIGALTVVMWVIDALAEWANPERARRKG